MARPELGLKRQCMSCGAKFYDLARDPAVCPKCGAVYQAVATSRVAAPVVARNTTPDDEDETDEKGPELVSLDEVEAAEDEADPTPEDDTVEDGDAAEDDTFLEEEDTGDDDVSDLIDGDIENDEES
ncbi:TIGR02300 family protein [Methylobacterium sp. NEAU K]|uniref:TIGR02300 family protein n=1 Tax=Methylobacterium sp. NEAU K TaxID=3064946 RepID=UPI0027373CAB|nr:TIGR02300 family protein [Methylobacterium sp. NEAU K]MDP4004434.1 TIGR02300 family protein [Methylobacterium sp. NEAU K]